MFVNKRFRNTGSVGQFPRRRAIKSFVGENASDSLDDSLAPLLGRQPL